MGKKIIKDIRLRHSARGTERRKNIAKEVFYKDTVFPEPLEYEDIDKAFSDFVENELDIAYDGLRLPTFTWFSSQRFSEYSQTWKHVDENRNLLMNFKTIGRDNNPTSGENQGGLWNIPGDRRYKIFETSVLDKNGTESYEVYTMKQPYSVDLNYKISIVTNRYELINKFNELVNSKFKSRQFYIRPNGYFVPMLLEDISDESEYSVDDRKFFHQSFTIKVMAYIIHESDFKVQTFPKRILIMSEGDSLRRKVDVDINEYDSNEYVERTVELKVKFENDVIRTVFNIDTDARFETIDADNVRCMRINVNGEPIFYENGFEVKNGDEIRIRVTKYEEGEKADVAFHGYIPGTVINTRDIVKEMVNESALSHEEITVE